MQKYISDCGIGIEANPTSNYCISAMKKYSEHPITKLYNMGLTVNLEEISNCPQMYNTIIVHTKLDTEESGCENAD